MIEARDNDFGIFGIGKTAMILISVLVVGLECLFSLAVETQLCYFLPTKNFLSAKNNQLQMTTFLQKFIIQMFMLVWKSDSRLLPWVVSVFSLSIDLVRYFLLYSKLPLYSIKALLWQGSLQSIATCLSLGCFVNVCLKTGDYRGASVNMVIVTWFLLALLLIKINHAACQTIILRLLVSPKDNERVAPEILLHKIMATKQLKKSEEYPAEENTNYNFNYLVSMNQNLKIQEIFQLNQNNSEVTSLKTMKRIFLLYLEELSKRFPKNYLIRLHTAYKSFKYQSESYSKTIKIATSIAKNRWSARYLSASLLLHEIEISLLKAHQEDNSSESLDFLTYLKSKVQFEDIKKKMMDQTNLCIKVCENILDNNSNIESIHDSAQKISKLKRRILKAINNTSLPEHYISPYLCYAEYSLVVNHSLTDYEKYSQRYSNKHYRAGKPFKEPQLSQDNLYQEPNAFLLISGQNADCGKIRFANKSLADLCGGTSSQGYLNSHVSMLFPYSLRAYYDHLFRQSLEGEDNSLLNKAHRAYVYHKNKYLIEVDFCMKYHPYLVQGLCLDLIIRPVPNHTDYLLIKEDGDIEGASKKIAKVLRLNEAVHGNIKNSVSLRLFSEELYNANLAFSIVQKNGFLISETGSKTPPMIKQTKMSRFQKEKDRAYGPLSHASSPVLNMPYDRAVEIYKSFNKQDQEIELNPFGKGAKEFEALTFYARIQMISYGDINMRAVTLRASGRNKNLRLPTLPCKTRGEEEDDDGISENFKHLDEKDDEFPQVTTYNKQTTIGGFNDRPSLVTMSPKQTLQDTPLLSATARSQKRFFFADPISTQRLDSPSTLTDRNPLVIPAQVEKTPTLSDPNLAENNELIYSYGRDEVKKNINSNSGQQENNSQALKLAINSKSYPRSFRVFCLIFYGVVCIAFVGQIIMKVVSDNTMTGLEFRKNLLKYSEERSYKAALLHINAVGLGLQILGALSAGGDILGLQEAVDNMQIRLRDMKEANDNMLKDTYSLEEEIQKELFLADVKMIGTYLDSTDTTEKKVNTFQATQEVTNAVKALYALPDAKTTAGYHIFNYLTNNLMDDFQYKSVQITDTFTSSVEQQKESYQTTSNFFLSLNPCLLAGIGVFLCVIIWNQYRIEKENMKAFIKIRSGGVRIIANRLLQFRKSIQNEETFENSQAIRDFENLHEGEQKSDYSKRESNQNINYKGFLRRYYKYTARVIFCILILLGISIWDFVTTKQAIKVIYNRQEQLQYANYISNRVSVGYAAYCVLFAKNNTLKVEHKTALEALYDSYDEVRQIQSEIATKFVEVDGTYNPDVKNILFEDNPECTGFTSDTILYCTTLLGLGQPVNMLIAIASYQTILENKYRDYSDADKTSLTTILTAAYLNVQSFLSNFCVLAHEAQLISEIMDKSMMEKITQNRHRRMLIMSVFSVSLVIVSVFFWVKVLKVIREVENDFKKVLQIFPANLVLSSYLIKRFLMNASNTSGSLFFF